jgi:hypothetical protein
MRHTQSGHRRSEKLERLADWIALHSPDNIKSGQ